MLLIESLSMGNFQGFGRDVRVPLKPLTLIFGANASGKSSIIRALLLLRQAAPSRGNFRGPVGFSFEGPDISLASFANAVHKHDESQRIMVGVSHSSRAELPSLNPYLMSMRRIVKSVETKFFIGSNSKIVGLVLSFSLVNGNSLELNFTEQGGLVKVFDFFDSGAMDTIATSLPDVEPDNMGADFEEGSEVAAQPYASNLDLAWEEVFQQLDFSWFRMSVSPRRESKVPETQLQVVTHLLALARMSLYKELAIINHIGPLREISARLSFEGENRRQKPLKASSGEAVPPDHEIVSAWLHNLTEGRYSFEPVEFSAPEVSFLGVLQSQILIDNLTNTPVTFADVGVGLSQVLPILQALQQSEYRPEATIVIEQPELHLHPKMQASLTDLFVSFVNQNPNSQIIAETHSEAMLLRLERRIREGVLKAEDVEILFVDKDETSNRVTSVDLTSDGDFAQNMPLSFSSLRLDDLL